MKSEEKEQRDKCTSVDERERKTYYLDKSIINKVTATVEEVVSRDLFTLRQLKFIFFFSTHEMQGHLESQRRLQKQPSLLH